MKTAKPKKKLITLPKLKKKIWKIFSAYIRQKGVSADGYTCCFTCGIGGHWKTMDAGHYIHGKLDFDERNIKIQCSRCNRWLHGNLGIYGEILMINYGDAWVEKLRQDARTKGNSYSRQELNDLLEKYGTK